MHNAARVHRFECIGIEIIYVYVVKCLTREQKPLSGYVVFYVKVQTAGCER